MWSVSPSIDEDNDGGNQPVLLAAPWRQYSIPRDLRSLDCLRLAVGRLVRPAVTLQEHPASDRDQKRG